MRAPDLLGIGGSHGAISRAESGANSSRPLIVTPLRIEALIVRAGVRGARARVSGMGPERARAAARELAGQPGDALLILGFCGALEQDAVPGDVVVADRLLDADRSPDVVTRAGTDTLVASLERSGLRVRCGPIVCVSRLALGERRVELRERFGAIAVDMESAWLAAGAAGRPCGVVRVVLDSPSHELLRLGAARGAVRAALALRRVAAALHDGAPGL